MTITDTYRLTAVMTDRKGNSTDLAEMLLQVEPNTAQIGSGDLVVNKETAVADGADIVTYMA
ncbi:hypothetical protein [Candidatus Regiella insecticola]|uniref:hypothetical protein n=1 Tax=Candidatus Regiella insecticola TaxID=138073 RepID=UPI00030371BB|nr:hypothetical protein [Candidatus Regiella insecticola]